MYASAYRGQKRVSDSLKLELYALRGCWVLNCGHLEEQKDSAVEPSLQTHIPFSLNQSPVPGRIMPSFIKASTWHLLQTGIQWKPMGGGVMKRSHFLTRGHSREWYSSKSRCQGLRGKEKGLSLAHGQGGRLLKESKILLPG